MAECIRFENSFQKRPYSFEFNPSTEWTVREVWTTNPNIVQNITLIKEDYFESYYYADLEIESAFEECSVKIEKTERAASNNIQFVINGHEYSCFEGYPIIVNNAQKHKHRYKITVTPILQFRSEIFRRPGKRTKIDLLEGLKGLSNNISTLKDAEDCDIILHCGVRKVKAHKNILAARSPLFNKVLHAAEEDEERESCLKMQRKITSVDNGDGRSDDHSGDDSNATTILEKKNQDVENGSEIKECISAAGALVEQGKEDQNDFEKETEFNNNDDDVISAMPVSDEVKNQNNLKTEKRKLDDNDDSSAMSIKKDEEVDDDDDSASMSTENDGVENSSIINFDDNAEAMYREEGKKEENLEIALSKSNANIDDDEELNIMKASINNINSSIFDDFIDFIYSGWYKTFDIEKAKELLTVARTYGVYDLESKCVVYLKRRISTETCDDIYNFATRIECEKLQNHVLDFIKNKATGRRWRIGEFVPLTEEEKMRWMPIMRTHTAYLSDILKVKKNKKLRDMLWGDAAADCAECLNDILDICVDIVNNIED